MAKLAANNKLFVKLIQSFTERQQEIWASVIQTKPKNILLLARRLLMKQKLKD